MNATVARNSAKVDLVASGRSGRQELDARFDAPNGYEAYARTERSQPYIRDTYDVWVIIVRDGRAAKGFRVDTAFPGDFGRSSPWVIWKWNFITQQPGRNFQ